jgi:hypothetical protein
MKICCRSIDKIILTLGLVLISSQTVFPLELTGATVTPHVGTPGVRFRRPPLAPLDARVQLFLRNNDTQTAETSRPCGLGQILFNDKKAATCLEEGLWSWHDSPTVWTDTERNIPPDALMVWTFNSIGEQLGNTLQLQINDDQGQARHRLDVPIQRPRLWLSTVTFLGSPENVHPDQVIFYIHNETEKAWRIVDGRLYLPRERETWRWLYPRPWMGAKVRAFPASGIIEPSELGGARVSTGPLPLTYTALEVKLRNEDGDPTSLWAHLRLKKETFDISGGWVNSSTLKGQTLTHEPFLKTLRRMHINTAHIGKVSGYTDQTGPGKLYTRYPLKYFNKLWPIERYDIDEMLPRVHAVEFLGEPQYRYGRNDKLPQQVWEAFLPYAKSRFATTLTLSESQNWHLYAGLADYPHYDAYRVTAPSPDTWSLYDRWDGQNIRWGSPLETIGEMTRSLRQTNRPAPIAYWSQGAHHGWGHYGGRVRTSPTPDELRLQAYHALSSRITSLYWFNLSLKSLVKYRDLIDEITRVGREMRMLEQFYLEGAAYRYEQIRPEGKLDWDLASIITPDSALLFALDLDYEADPTEKIFRFGPPRPVRFEFALPPFLREPSDIFRIDADGIYPARCESTSLGIRIEDQVSKVAVYVATAVPDLREKLERRRRELLQLEESFKFDPGQSDTDFERLTSLLAPN